MTGALSITPRARQMLGFIVARHRAGRPWTYEEAMQRLGAKSKERPFALVTQLQERGYVRRDRRGRVSLLPPAHVAVPVVPVRAFTGELHRCAPDGSWPYRDHRTVAEVWAAEGAAR